MDCSSSTTTSGGDALGGRLRAAVARFAPAAAAGVSWPSKHQLDAISVACTGARLNRTLRDGLAAAVAPGAAPGADAWRLLELSLRRTAAAAEPEAHLRAVFSALGGGGVLSRQDFAAAARQAAPQLPPLAVGEAFDALSGGSGGLSCRSFVAAATARQRHQM